jgi:DNA-directed RNA polymerase subunit N (RpoN/RPB10)
MYLSREAIFVNNRHSLKTLPIGRYCLRRYLIIYGKALLSDVITSPPNDMPLADES